jgi:hypothetical protein
MMSKRNCRIRVLLALFWHVSVASFQLPQGMRHWNRPTPLYDSRPKQHLNSEGLEHAERPLPMKGLVDAADNELRLQEIAQQIDTDDEAAMNRRLFMGAAILGASAVLANGPESLQAASAATDDATSSQNNRGFGKLNWASTPVNKRTGVTVFDAEKFGYNVRFVTYLSRFLLSFDDDCQKWWYSRAADIPRRASVEEVEQIRLKQFAAFSASVEVGLQEYRGKDGPAKLMEALVTRYCPDIETVRLKREKRGLAKLSQEKGEL